MTRFKFWFFRSLVKLKKCYQNHGILLLIILVMLIYLLIALAISDSDENSLVNRYAETINTLFAGFAFAALIYTISQQRTDLELQRRQIKLSIKEQRDANKEFKKQNENIELQRFDNTYFNMINNLRLNLSSVRVSYNDKTFFGVNAFKEIKEDVQSQFYARKKSPKYNETNLASIIHSLTTLFKSIDNEKHFYITAQSYFNTLAGIVTYINKHKPILKGNDFYYKYLISQIDSEVLDYIEYSYFFGDRLAKSTFLLIVKSLDLIEDDETTLNSLLHAD